MNVSFRFFCADSDLSWVKKRIPILRTEDTCGLVAFNKRNNKTLGVIVFDHFLRNSCNASIVVDTPMVFKHGFLELAANMAFLTWGLEYVYFYVAETNRLCLRLCERMGAKQKYRLPDAFKHGVDLILLEVRSDECPFYKKYSEAA